MPTCEKCQAFGSACDCHEIIADLEREVDDLKSLARNLWESRRRMAYGPEHTKIMLARHPYLEQEGDSDG